MFREFWMIHWKFLFHHDALKRIAYLNQGFKEELSSDCDTYLKKSQTLYSIIHKNAVELVFNVSILYELYFYLWNIRSLVICVVLNRSLSEGFLFRTYLQGKWSGQKTAMLNQRFFSMLNKIQTNMRSAQQWAQYEIRFEQ